MLSPEVRTAKQVVEDYKKFNQNTVKKVAKRCPVSRAIFYETVKIDENAQLFVEKYKKEAKKKKQEKHLGKQLMNAPKKKPKPPVQKLPKEKTPRTYIKLHETTNGLSRMKKCYEMSRSGKSTKEIACEMDISIGTVSKYIFEYKKLNGIKEKLNYKTQSIYNLIKEGLSKKQIIEKININPRTLIYHINVIKKVYPDLIPSQNIVVGGKKLPKSIKVYSNTSTIQKLLAEGKSISEIADIVKIKKSSVFNNIARFNKKIGTYAYKGKENKTEIIQQYLKEGKDLDEIAQCLGIKRKSVLANICEYNKKNGTHKDKRTNDNHLIVEKFLKKECSIREISTETGLSYGAVRLNIKKLEKQTK